MKSIKYWEDYEKNFRELNEYFDVVYNIKRKINGESINVRLKTKDRKELEGMLFTGKHGLTFEFKEKDKLYRKEYYLEDITIAAELLLKKNNTEIWGISSFKTEEIIEMKNCLLKSVSL